MKSFENIELGVKLLIEDNGDYSVTSTKPRRESFLCDDRIWNWVTKILIDNSGYAN